MVLLFHPDLKIDTVSKPTPNLLHHAHCSGVVEFDDGEVLVVYYHALVEANRKQAIYGVRKSKDKDWSDAFLVSKDKPNRMEGNPCIWIAPDTGILWLFYVTSFGGWAVCTPRYKTSNDKGRTWGKSVKIYKLFSQVTKNPPILTSKGWYILPVYTEFRHYISRFYISKDQGKKWKSYGKVVNHYDTPPENPKLINAILQPTLIERNDGSLLALMRARWGLGKMYKSESFDGGLTWSPGVPGNLPNPGGGFHMIKLKSGNICIIYNHSPSPGQEGRPRNPLSVAISTDDGITWAYRQNIAEYHESKGDSLPNSFGYPTIYQGPTGIIHATWSFSHEVNAENMKINATDIQYTSFSEDWIMKNKYFDDAWQLEK